MQLSSYQQARYTEGFRWSGIEKIKKYKIGSAENIINDNYILNLTFLENTQMLQQITANRADYMIMAKNEFQYFKKNNFEIVKYLTFKGFSDIKVGNKRFLFCSKKIGKTNMKKINDSILKNLGKI